jgi:single-strand DNA-binding protein
MRVAVTQRIQQDGEWRDGDTSFLRVNVWRGQAEHLADSLAKGDRVMVTGRLRQRSWETPRATSARSPRSRPTRSAPASSGPPPRSNAPPSAATATALRRGSARPSVAATSTTSRHSDQSLLGAPSRPRLGAPAYRGTLTSLGSQAPATGSCVPSFTPTSSITTVDPSAPSRYRTSLSGSPVRDPLYLGHRGVRICNECVAKFAESLARSGPGTPS